MIKSKMHFLFSIIAFCIMSIDGNYIMASESAVPFITSYKTITIDGNFHDWDANDRVYLDIDGPKCGDLPGRSLKEVYVAQDDEFVYLRIVLYGPPEGGVTYIFGQQLLVYVRYLSGKWGISYSSPDGVTMPSIPESFLAINGNQFECKFYKTEVIKYWKDKTLLASCWGADPNCNDQVSLRTAFRWAFVNHRVLEDGTRNNRIGFELRYPDGSEIKDESLLTSFTLCDKNNNAINIPELVYIACLHFS